MRPAHIGQREVDRRQGEWRRFADLVDPGERGAAGMDLSLPQQPAGKSAVGCGRIDRDAANVEMAVACTPHPEYKTLQFDARETRLQEQQRTPGKCGFEFRQVERRMALPVVQAHTVQTEFRACLLPYARHFFQRHPLPQRTRHEVGDRIAMRCNIRQHPEEHQGHCRCKAHGGQRRQRCQPARSAAQEQGQGGGNGHKNTVLGPADSMRLALFCGGKIPVNSGFHSPVKR